MENSPFPSRVVPFYAFPYSNLISPTYNIMLAEWWKLGTEWCLTEGMCVSRLNVQLMNLADFHYSS